MPPVPTTHRDLAWTFSGGTVHLSAPTDAPVRILGLTAPGAPLPEGRGSFLVEVAADGDGHAATNSHSEHFSYRTSHRLRHLGHEEVDGPRGPELHVTQGDPDTGLRVVSVLRDEGGAGAVRAWTRVRNEGPGPVRLRYVSSLTLAGFTADTASWRNTRVHVVRNGWAAEFRWLSSTLEQAGIVAIGYADHPAPPSTRSRFPVTALGAWSSGDFVPVGALTDDTGRAWLWQLEHNGPWHWELCDAEPDLRVRLSGPTEQEHAWTTLLQPGEEFTSVPVAAVASGSGLEDAIGVLTRYRRAIRRPNADDEDLPVVFNDYMNALWGNPTTERLLPLVDAAAEAGAEYFVVDCGWYTDEENWWDLPGDWVESARRFPGGMAEVFDRIRARGMVPGLWLEPEVAGVRSTRARELPDEAFFTRDGHRVFENERYQLDLRHPAVLAHLDATVDRLVERYGIGYFKFDHNINAAPGTDVDADSPGEGMLAHNRAVSAWLDGLFARHPHLVVENCSSGGLRVDHAQLSRLSIQSTSDQDDLLLYAPIAAAAPSVLTPEQAAVWAYPQAGMDPELLAFTMANAMLSRVHLSGLLNRMEQGDLAAVRAAVDVYKDLRAAIPRSLPFWPLGLPGWYDEWLATGLLDGGEVLLTVWRRGGQDSARLAVPALAGAHVDVELLYPADSAATPAPTTAWEAATGTLAVTLPTAPSARVLRLRRT
ncbi:hypothetical protein NUM3379_13960 [Kineococcus sp. NUM-3379]